MASVIVRLWGLSRGGRLERGRERLLAAASAGVQDKTAALLAGYQAGDGRAFCEFHSLLRPFLAAHLLSLGADELGLDALLDRVFLQIHAARRTWRPGSPVEPWVTAIAGHVFRSAAAPQAGQILSD